MLTARRAFPGSDVSETLASVLAREADLSVLPAGTPPSVAALLRACLQKERTDRLRDIGDAWLTVDSADDGQAPPSIGGRSALVAWSVAAAAVIIAAVAGVATWRMPPADTSDAPAPRFALVSDPELQVLTSSTQPFAISPDGQTVIFAANAGSGLNLWVRRLDSIEPRMLAGTNGAYQPAISPDGEWVAFVVANHLIRKMRITGGDVTTVVSLDDLTASIAWMSDDELVFEMIGSRSGVHRVKAGGGRPELLVPLDGSTQETTQRRPFVLREDGMVLYASSVAEGPTTIAIASLDGARRRRPRAVGVRPRVRRSHARYARRPLPLMEAPNLASSCRSTDLPAKPPCCPTTARWSRSARIRAAAPGCSWCPFPTGAKPRSSRTRGRAGRVAPDLESRQPASVLPERGRADARAVADGRGARRHTGAGFDVAAPGARSRRVTRRQDVPDAPAGPSCAQRDRCRRLDA